MDAAKHLIVNADDFGQSPGINRGIIEAHERGIVTSASLMVRWTAASDAASYARRDPGFSIGLHLDFGEWISRDGEWAPLYQVVPTDDTQAVSDEARRQLEAFRRLVGRDPTHLDSHQHVHLRQPAQSVLVQMAGELGVPLRSCNSRVRYCGDFYGQTTEGLPLSEAISVQALIRILGSLPPGWTELACHPGLGGGLETMYGVEREQEVEALCSPLLGPVISGLGIKLGSFNRVGPSGV